MNKDSLQWITYPVFISSTFRDMDSERDAIRFNVIPRLNEHYRSCRVQFQAIDLRIGINTDYVREEERENFVLDVCFDKILQSRPFFIGLLGERYGWIPDNERWHYVVERMSSENRPLLNDSQGRSVTEMEILLGAIGNEGQYFNRSIFMFRSERSYDYIPIKDRALYQDKFNTSLNLSLRNNNVDRLEKLKKQIITLAEQKNLRENVCTYDLLWDKKMRKFRDMNNFSDCLFLRLCNEIDKEIKVIPNQLFTWQSQDKYNTEAYASLLIQRTVETEWLSEMYHILKQRDCNQLLFIGENGMGTSTIASLCWKYFIDEGYTVCFARIGISSHSRQIRPVIVRWIQQLSGKTEDQYSEHVLMNSNKITDAELYQLLSTLVKSENEKKEKVAFVLDGVDLFRSYCENELYSMWIEDSMTVVLTSHSDCSGLIKKYHPRMRAISMPSMKGNDKSFMLQAKAKAANIMLPQEVKNKIIKDVESPLQIDLLVALFSQLSIIDFNDIRKKKGDDMTNINNHLISLYEQAPKEFPKQSLYIIRTIVRRMGLSDKYYRLFVYLAASENGLRECDMEYLMGAEWEPLFFHTLSCIFDSVLLGDHFTQYWKISSPAIKDSLLADENSAVYDEIARYLLTLPDSDRLKQEILIYILIMSENNTLGREYMDIYTKFKGDNDLKIWLYTSTQILLGKPNRLCCLSNFIHGLPPSQTVTLIYYLIEMGIGDINKTQEAILWTDKLLGTINIKLLNRKAAFQLALLNMKAQQWEKFKGMQNRKSHLQRAVEALMWCYTLDPQSQNVKDYYCVALSEMADIEMIDGNYNEASKFLQLAMNIQ